MIKNLFILAYLFLRLSNMFIILKEILIDPSLQYYLYLDILHMHGKVFGDRLGIQRSRSIPFNLTENNTDVVTERLFAWILNEVEKEVHGYHVGKDLNNEIYLKIRVENRRF